MRRSQHPLLVRGAVAERRARAQNGRLRFDRLDEEARALDGVGEVERDDRLELAVPERSRPRRRRRVTKYVGWRRRYLPAAGPPIPLRSSSAGDSIPPAATTTIGASTVSSTSPPSAPRAVPATPAARPSSHEHAVDGAVDDEPRAGVGGVLQVGLERRLLAPLLAAGVAVAAERGSSSRRRVARQDLAAGGRDASSASAIIWFVRFGFVASVLTLIRCETASRCASNSGPSIPVEPERRPLGADPVGRAQADHRVDHRAAAERRAGEQADRAALGEEEPAAQVQLLRADGLELPEVRLVAVAGALEHDDLAAGRCSSAAITQPPAPEPTTQTSACSVARGPSSRLDRGSSSAPRRPRAARRRAPGSRARASSGSAVLVGQRVEEADHGALQLAQQLSRLAAAGAELVQRAACAASRSSAAKPRRLELGEHRLVPRPARSPPAASAGRGPTPSGAGTRVVSARRRRARRAGRACPRARRGSARRSRPVIAAIAASHRPLDRARARASTSSSRPRRPTICTPTGSPSGEVEHRDDRGRQPEGARELAVVEEVEDVRLAVAGLERRGRRRRASSIGQSSSQAKASRLELGHARPAVERRRAARPRTSSQIDLQLRRGLVERAEPLDDLAASRPRSADS